jgi:hypothetical protein
MISIGEPAITAGVAVIEPCFLYKKQRALISFDLIIFEISIIAEVIRFSVSSKFSITFIFMLVIEIVGIWESNPAEKC